MFRRVSATGSVRTAALGAIAALAMSAGCGGPKRPRLTELETITRSATELGVARLDVIYDGDRVRRLYRVVDGTTARWGKVKYDEQSRIGSIELFDGVDEELATTTFEYDRDDRVVLVRKIAANGDTSSREIDYDGGKLMKIIVRIGTFNPVTEETDLSSWTETWRYDGAQRPERILTEGKGEPIVTELSWDVVNDLLDGARTTSGTAETSSSYTYGDGRLVGVSEQGGGSSELTYDSDRIESISVSGGGGETMIRYFYDDGEVQGALPRPVVPHGFFFDLGGHILDDLGEPPLSSLLD